MKPGSPWPVLEEEELEDTTTLSVAYAASGKPVAKQYFVPSRVRIFQSKDGAHGRFRILVYRGQSSLIEILSKFSILI